MSINQIFSYTALLMTIFPPLLYLFLIHPQIVMNIGLLLFNVHKIFCKRRKKNILLITDFDSFNDYITVNLLVKMYNNGKVNIAGIVVNDNGEYEKTIQLRKYLRSLKVRDFNVPLAASLEDSVNEDKYKIISEEYGIDLWDGHQMLSDLQKDKPLSIVATGNVKSLVTILEKDVLSDEILTNEHEIFIYEKIDLRRKVDENKDRLYILGYRKFSFILFDDKIMDHLYLNDKNGYNVFGEIDKHKKAPLFVFLDGCNMLLSMLHEELFNVREFQNGKMLFYKRNTQKKIIDKLDNYFV